MGIAGTTESSRTTVVVPTSKGPSCVLDVMKEDPNPGRSTVCIGIHTTQAGIGSAYNDFVRSPPGVVHRLFGLSEFPSYRVTVSAPVETGFSWQLPILLAHALLEEDRLAGPSSDRSDVVWATGSVSSVDYAVGSVELVAEKIRTSLDMLLAFAEEGRRVRILMTGENVADVDPSSAERLRAAGIVPVAVASAQEAFAALGLAPIPAAATKPSSAKVGWTGNPYRGLEPFGREHRPVFFGRSRAREDVHERLLSAAAKGRPFLLVHGRSGSGKSSLVHAGLCADVEERSVRGPKFAIASTRPSEGGERPTALLAGTVRSVLGLPVEAGASADEVASAVASLPKSGPGARIALVVVDQLEEIFAPTVPADEVEAFGELLEKLVRTGVVWAVATIRSDAMGSLDRSPALARLAKPERIFRLDRPTLFELSEMIAGPAALAGRPFADRSIAEHLAEEAGRSPDSLPLLQDLLFRLFDQEDGSRSLTMRTLERMGGFEGTVGRSAEAVREGMLADGVPSDLIDDVLTGLVRIDPETRIPLSKPLRLDEAGTWGRNTWMRKIVDRLVAGRIAVSSEGSTGPTLRLSHEVLVTHWAHLASLAARLAETIRLRDEMQARAEVWMRSDMKDSELLHDLESAKEASRILSESSVHVPASVNDFLWFSANVAGAEENRRAKAVEDERRARELAVQVARQKTAFARRLALTASVSALLVGASAIYAYGRWQDSILQVERLDAATKLAREQRKTAENNLADFLATKGAAQVDALPTRTASELLPLVPEDDGVLEKQQIGDVLARAWWNEAFLFDQGWVLGVASADWTKDGGSILSVVPTRGDAGEPRSDAHGFSTFLTDTTTGATTSARSSEGAMEMSDRIFSVHGASGRTTSVELEGGRIAIVDGDGRSVSASLPGDPSPDWVEFDPSGGRIAIGTQEDVFVVGASDGKVARLSDAKSGSRFAGFDASGDVLATTAPGSDSVVLWDLAKGIPKQTLDGLQGVVAAAISRDGRRVAAGTADGILTIVRIGCDATDPDCGRRSYRAGAGGIDEISFSKDGRFLALVSKEKTIASWDVDADRIVQSIPTEGVSVRKVEWSPDGRSVMGLTGAGYAVWRVRGGASASAAGPNADARVLPRTMRLSPDGAKVVAIDGMRRMETTKADDLVDIVRRPRPPTFLRRGDVTLIVPEDYLEIEAADRGKDPAPYVNGDVQWSRDGTKLLVGDDFETVSVLDPADWKFSVHVKGKGTKFAWNPDGGSFAIADDAGVLTIAETKDGSTSRSFALGYKEGERTERLAWSPDGARIAVSTTDKLLIVSSSNGETIDRFDVWDERAPDDANGAPVRSLDWSPDGRLVLATMGTGRAYVVDADAHAVRSTLPVDDTIRTASFDPRRPLFLTTSASGKVRIHDLEDMVVVRTIESNSPIVAAVWTADGRSIHTSSDRMERWDTSSVPTFDVIVDVLRYASPTDGYAQSEETLADADPCDAASGNPYDPAMPTHAIAVRLNFLALRKSSDPSRCMASIERDPKEPRFRYNLWRAYARTDERPKGIELLKALASEGYPMAVFDLAEAKASGDGMDRDASEADGLYAKALDLGIGAAAFRLGSTAEIEGDRMKALSLWRRGSELGSPECHARLAEYAEAEGSSGLPKALGHYAEATRLYEEAGDPEAGETREKRRRLARLLDPATVSSVRQEIVRRIRTNDPGRTSSLP